MVPIFYIPMHDVVPSVVAMAVRMVMAMCRIFCQMVWLFMVFLCYELLVMGFCGWFCFSPRIDTDLFNFLVIQTTEGRKDLEYIHVGVYVYVLEILRFVSLRSE